MRFMQRSLMGLFLLFLALGLLSLAGGAIRDAFEARRNGQPHRPPARERVFAAEVVVARPRSIRPVIVTYGEVRSSRTLELRAAAGGRIVALSPGFVEGGRVKAGEELMRLDAADARAALERARTEMDAARAELAEAEAALALALQELEAAERQARLRRAALERQQSLLERGVGTEAALEAAALQQAAAEQAVLARRQAVAQARARIARARTDIARRRIALTEAERGLRDTRLVAAFDGLLGGVSAVEGGLVARNERIGRLIDPAALEVSFRLSTRQFARLDSDRGVIGLPVTVRLEVFGEGFAARGRVSRIGAEVGAGQTGRQVFAALDAGAGGFLRPGDFVTVELAEPPLDDVIALPAAAVDSRETVLVLGPDDRLTARPVTVLRRLGEQVLLAPDGLVGERVVAVRSPLLGAGIKVRPMLREGTAPAASSGPARDSATAAPAGDRGEESGPMIALSPERRRRLIEFVRASDRLPGEVKTRILERLQGERVPAEMVTRIEARMGG